MQPLVAIPAGTELTIVMPIYNEEGNIETVLDDWRKALSNLGISFSLLALNDGSTDRTSDILRRLAGQCSAIIPVDKLHTGHGRTCRMGYDLSVATGTQWVLQVDSDGQCDPAYLRQFWDGRRDAECVFGVRTSRGDGLLRHTISFFCPYAAGWLTGTKLKDANVPYRLMRGEVLREAVSRVRSDVDVHNVAISIALHRNPGVRWKFIPIRFLPRRSGQNSINTKKIVQLGWNMLRELRQQSR